MAVVEYPIHMYKNLNRPRYAHDRKAVDALTIDGWTDIRANIGPQEYPCTLYSLGGETELVGDYDRDGVVDLVKAQNRETELMAKGWSRKAVIKITEDEKTAPLSFSESVNAASKQTARIEVIEQALASTGADLEAVIENQKQQGKDIADLKTGIDSILATLTKPKTRRVEAE